MIVSTIFLALVGAASTGSLLWDGRLNNYKTAAFLDDWSWSNQVGPYQYYIHGSGSRGDYIALSPDYQNLADTGSNKGIQISIDKTSSWNGQTMLRTELIPQTSAAINKGKVFYHFSIQHTGTNPPTPTEEHQVCFFESHFTEMKFGAQGDSSNLLQWYADSQSHWNATFEKGVWHNIAYGIDFDAQTVEFYHSTGGKDLILAAGPVSASTSSNGADWHLGVLRLPSSSGSSDLVREDWHFSGVYIEKSEVTKSVAGPDGRAESETVVAIANAVFASTIRTATPAQTTFTAPTTLQTKVKTSSGTVDSLMDSLESFDFQTSTSATALDTTLPCDTAENPASTFSATTSISLTRLSPTTLESWYAETASASELFGTMSSVVVASNPASMFTATAVSLAPTATDG